MERTDSATPWKLIICHKPIGVCGLIGQNVTAVFTQIPLAARDFAACRDHHLGNHGAAAEFI